jgi:hypothetical protein
MWRKFLRRLLLLVNAVLEQAEFPKKTSFSCFRLVFIQTLIRVAPKLLAHCQRLCVALLRAVSHHNRLKPSELIQRHTAPCGLLLHKTLMFDCHSVLSLMV